MKGQMKFIEVTDYDRGLKCLISADKISSVVCDGDGIVFIEMGVDSKGTSSGILVEETFDEIKKQINSEN